jgi:hypothetical protein
MRRLSFPRPTGRLGVKMERVLSHELISAARHAGFTAAAAAAAGGVTRCADGDGSCNGVAALRGL